MTKDGSHLVSSVLRRFNPLRRDRRRWGRLHNPDGTMTLVDHLYELRYRLGVALVAIVIGGAFGFWWFAHSLFGLPTLGEVITGPYCALPESMRFSPQPGTCQLLQTQPFEVFMLRIKVGLSVGAVLFSPVWLYQLWAFITPGLHPKERTSPTSHSLADPGRTHCAVSNTEQRPTVLRSQDPIHGGRRVADRPARQLTITPHSWQRTTDKQKTLSITSARTPTGRGRWEPLGRERLRPPESADGAQPPWSACPCRALLAG